MPAAKKLLSLFLCALLLAPAAAMAADSQDRVAKTRAERERLFTKPCPLSATDPEFVDTRDNLVLGQIFQKGVLTSEQRMLVLVTTMATLGSSSSLASWTRAALRTGVDPVAIREAVYQATPYIGYARAFDALTTINGVYEENGVKMPSEPRATVTEKTRFRDGLAVQKRIFGDGIDTMHKNAPKGQEDLVIEHLSAWCFGDTYTRKGLDLKTRELLTFVAIAALGGCDPQAKSHAQGNLSVGNSKQMLVDTLTVMLPYIGYPRTLNALAQVNAVAR